MDGISIRGMREDHAEMWSALKTRMKALVRRALWPRPISVSGTRLIRPLGPILPARICRQIPVRGSFELQSPHTGVSIKVAADGNDMIAELFFGMACRNLRSQRTDFCGSSSLRVAHSLISARASEFTRSQLAL